MYKVKLKSFEGPFDLLVYLIENADDNNYSLLCTDAKTGKTGERPF